jgi:hypothetical protein
VQQDVLDPPEDCFRIRLIITLLQTCGHYFSKGSSKRKLDKFLLHFQRYIISKGPLPLDIEFDIQVSSFCIQLADMRELRMSIFTMGVGTRATRSEYIHKTSMLQTES